MQSQSNISSAIITKRNLTLCVLLGLLSLFSQNKSFAIDPSSSPLAVTTFEYNFGGDAFEPVLPVVPDAPQDLPRLFTEFQAEVYHPSDLSHGPFPIVFIMHGATRTCYQVSEGRIRTRFSTYPCPSEFEVTPAYRGFDYFGTELASQGFIVVSISAQGISEVDGRVISRRELGLDRNAQSERGQLFDAHLQLWETLNEVGDERIGSQFIGAVDLENIGIMGHSRGGGGVIAYYDEYVQQATERNREPRNIKAVLALAATDDINSGRPLELDPDSGFVEYVATDVGRPTIQNVPFLNIQGTCDSDTLGLQSIRFYDESRYKVEGDIGPKFNIFLRGGNHNFFNTNTYPGDQNDVPLFGNVDNSCSNSESFPEFPLMEPEVQQNALITYGSLFFRAYLAKERSLVSQLQGREPADGLLADSRAIRISYHAPDIPGFRLDINRLDDSSNLFENSLGGLVSGEQLEDFRLCGKLPGSGLLPCNWTTPTGMLSVGEGRRIDRIEFTEQIYHDLPLYIISDTQTPHNHSTTQRGHLYDQDSNLGTSAVRLAWDQLNGEEDSIPRFDNAIPFRYSNFSRYEAIKFRASVDFDELKGIFIGFGDRSVLETRNSLGQDQDFSVELTDIWGNVSSVPVSEHSTALYFPDGHDPNATGISRNFPKQLFNDVQIPLSAFSGIETKSITKVAFVFDKTESGSILVNDLALIGGQECTVGLSDAITDDRHPGFIQGTQGDDVLLATDSRFNYFDATKGRDCVVTGAGFNIVIANEDTQVVEGEGRTRIIRIPSYPY